MISISSPTRTAYTFSIEQGSVSSGSVSFESRGVSLTPTGGNEILLSEATNVSGAIQSLPKEEN